MAESCSGTSFSSSTPSLLGSDQKSYISVDSNCSNGSARKAKTAFEKLQQMESEDLKQFQRMFSDALLQQSKSNTGFKEPTWKQQDPPLAFHRGLESIASSLSLLTKTLGMALEEQRNLVEVTANDSMYMEDEGKHLTDSEDEGKHLTESEDEGKHRNESSGDQKDLSSPPKLQACSEKRSEVTKHTQMKTSRDIAMAMTTKAKLLVRELKRIKNDLNFMKDRCAQMEEENKRLRESIDKGVRHEEDDLVRLQLEALLMEKARLAQENATYARENQFLHEAVQYHQLKLRNIALPDDALALDDELSLDAAALEMDFLPMYAPDEENFIVSEESLEMAS